MLNKIPNTIVLSYRLQQCAEINERRNTDSINHIVQLSLLSVLSPFFVYACVQLRGKAMRLSVYVRPHTCTSYLCLYLFSYERHKGRGSL